MSVLSRPEFHDEAAAFAHLEATLWPNGPTCPHCGNCDAAKIGDLKLQTTEKEAHIVPPLLSEGALALGVILIGAGLYRRR